MSQEVVVYARLDPTRLRRNVGRLGHCFAEVGLHLREARAVATRLLAFPAAELQVTFELPVAIRSVQANKYYWGVVVEAISDFTGYERDEVHELLKQLFLPKPLWLHDAEGEVVGKLVISQSTTTLTVTEFYNYVERIRRWAATTLHINIPDPNEPLPNDETGAAYPRRVA